MLKTIYDKDYVRVASCVPPVKPGDTRHNCTQIISMLNEASERGVTVALFPELSVTGYTCGDLFNQELLITAARQALDEIAKSTRGSNTYAIVGLPYRIDGRLYNCAALIGKGSVIGIVAKSHLPNYGEFYEKRWFHSGSIFKPQIFSITTQGGSRVNIGIEICEDLWVPEPPSGLLSKMGAEIIFNPSASDENIGKHRYLTDLIKNQSARCRCGYVYSSAGFGESSTDLAYSGNAIIAEQGVLLQEGKRFSLRPQMSIADIDVDAIRNDRMKYATFNEASYTDMIVSTSVTSSENNVSLHIEELRDCTTEKSIDMSEVELLRKVSPTPFVDDNKKDLDTRCEEIISIQSWGLMQRLNATGMKKAVIGISGGLDSTLALLITVKAFDELEIPRENIVAVTMPGMGTTERTHNNANDLMKHLGVTIKEISITKAVEQHFKDIDHDPIVTDSTYENSQARERTQILMDLSNQCGGLVIGTGDLSELALGWCTYNGDQMSMYGVNASVPKTLVKHLVRWFAQTGSPEFSKTLIDIVETPISPELTPATSDGKIEQKTEDLVGPYELHDFFIYHMLRHSERPAKIFSLATQAFAGVYDSRTILKWLKVFIRRFFNQQFKRSAMPDGVKVGSVCLSPRGDWRMPSDASSSLWQDDLLEIENTLSMKQEMQEALNKKQ